MGDGEVPTCCSIANCFLHHSQAYGVSIEWSARMWYLRCVRRLKAFSQTVHLDRGNNVNCIHHMRRVMRKQTLRSLSWPRPSFFWHEDFSRISSMISAESNSEKLVSYQKNDGRGHARRSFFWYNNDKGGSFPYRLGITMTKTLRSVFSWRASDD